MTAEQRQRVEELIDEYRVALHDSLNDLSEEEARRRLVPSKTTLLGLVKHATFVEGVWFDQAVTGRLVRGGRHRRDRRRLRRRWGKGDTIVDGCRLRTRERWATSRTNLAGLPSDAIVDGRGVRPVWALQLEVLRELAQHAGHAEILREQIAREPLAQALHRRADVPDTR